MWTGFGSSGSYTNSWDSVSSVTVRHLQECILYFILQSMYLYCMYVCTVYIRWYAPCTVLMFIPSCCDGLHTCGAVLRFGESIFGLLLSHIDRIYIYTYCTHASRHRPSLHIAFTTYLHLRPYTLISIIVSDAPIITNIEARQNKGRGDWGPEFLSVTARFRSFAWPVICGSEIFMSCPSTTRETKNATAAEKAKLFVWLSAASEWQLSLSKWYAFCANGCNTYVSGIRESWLADSSRYRLFDPSLLTAGVVRRWMACGDVLATFYFYYVHMYCNPSWPEVSLEIRKWQACREVVVAEWEQGLLLFSIVYVDTYIIPLRWCCIGLTRLVFTRYVYFCISYSYL